MLNFRNLSYPREALNGKIVTTCLINDSTSHKRPCLPYSVSSCSLYLGIFGRTGYFLPLQLITFWNSDRLFLTKRCITGGIFILLLVLLEPSHTVCQTHTTNMWGLFEHGAVVLKKKNAITKYIYKKKALLIYRRNSSLLDAIRQKFWIEAHF